MSTATDVATGVKIFGRNPAFWPGIIEGALAVLVAFSLGVTNESAGLISALISVLVAGYTAWATKDTSLAWATGAAKAAVALFVYYGVDLTAEQISAVVLFVPILVGAWQRTQTSPVAYPVDPSPPQVVPVAPTAEVAAAIDADTAPSTTVGETYASDDKVAAALHGSEPLEDTSIVGFDDTAEGEPSARVGHRQTLGPTRVIAYNEGGYVGKHSTE